MTREQAQELVMVLAAAFRPVLRGMSDADMRTWSSVYALGLEDLEVSAARASVDRLVRTSRFLPTVAEIRAGVVTRREGQKRTGAEAWGDVMRVMGLPPSARLEGVLVGRRGEDQPEFADELVNRCVNALG